jgi:Tfp pilus assembly pilus retraction ATPase PilT
MSEARALVDARRSLLMQRVDLILATDDDGDGRQMAIAAIADEIAFLRSFYESLLTLEDGIRE